MKTNPCTQYKEQIQLYCRGDLIAEQAELLLEHLRQCPDCRDYHQSLLAGDKLLSEWAESLEPWIQSGQDKLRRRLHQEDIRQQPVRPWFTRQLIGSAIAAMITLMAGFFAGRLWHPDIDSQKLFEQWSRTMQPQMQQDVAALVMTQLGPQLATFQKELAQQCQTQINASTLKALQETHQANYQLLDNLTDALEAIYIQDRQTIALALYQIEQNRIRDKNNLENNIMTMLTDLDYPLVRQQFGSFSVPSAAQTESMNQVQ